MEPTLTTEPMTKKRRASAEKIVLHIGDATYNCANAEEISAILAQYEETKQKRVDLGDDPYLRLQAAMELIAKSPTRGTPPAAIQAKLGLQSARSVSGLSKGWYKIFRDLGFRRFEDVLVNKDAWRNHARWFPGKLFEEAKEALDKVIAEES